MKRFMTLLLIMGFLSGCDGPGSGESIALPKGYKFVETRNFKSPGECVEFARTRHNGDDVTKVFEDTKVKEIYAAYINLSNGHSLLQTCTTFQGESKFSLVEADRLVIK